MNQEKNLKQHEKNLKEIEKIPLLIDQLFESMARHFGPMYTQEEDKEEGEHANPPHKPPSLS